MRHGKFRWTTMGRVYERKNEPTDNFCTICAITPVGDNYIRISRAGKSVFIFSSTWNFISSKMAAGERNIFDSSSGERETEVIFRHPIVFRVSHCTSLWRRILGHYTLFRYIYDVTRWIRHKCFQWPWVKLVSWFSIALTVVYPSTSIHVFYL